MSAAAADVPLRDRRLRVLGVTRLHLRAGPKACAEAGVRMAEPPAALAPATRGPAAVGAASITRICRLALQTDQAERRDPAIARMYTALTEAVAKVGLQPVRVCDVADDPSAAVMVFGAAPVPEGVPAVRVLRADPLAVLHVDRERKRRLWEQLLNLGSGRSG